MLQMFMVLTAMQFPGIISINDPLIDKRIANVIPIVIKMVAGKTAAGTFMDKQIIHISPKEVKKANPVYCLAQNIYYEAQNQSIRGQIAVTNIVFNRVNSPYYPNDICSVIKEKAQFSWTNDGKSDTPINNYAWRHAYRLAARLYVKHILQPHMVYLQGALSYHADYVYPDWAYTKTKITKIDNHIFYR